MTEKNHKKNIVLIGMPGAGKSTIGLLLAKAVNMPFVDTDLLIQQSQDRFLQQIVDEDGIESFIKVEEETILGLNYHNHIIATGGSVIYSEASISKLKEDGILVYLNVKLYQLERRLKNIKSRGIAMEEGQTLKDLYHERTPLYKKYADIEIDCARKHIEQIILEIKTNLNDRGIL